MFNSWRYDFSMEIKTANFVTSSSEYTQCPPADKPEYAFIGRSNVGKSSLINMITNFGKLAKISGKPGKTQLINHFLINEQWYLVDLPGYGFAKVSKTQKEQFEPMIKNYIVNRENLTSMMVLIDSRLPPQPIDLSFINWLGEVEIPFALVFTKADKQSVNKTQASVAAFKKKILEDWEVLPPYFVTSASSKTGREELLQYIGEINKQI